jgi:formate dehydrogenase major subunit
MRFFKEESCGQCTPCRVGTAKALALMDEKRCWDQPLLQELSQAMMDASICGLGQAAPNPVQCVSVLPAGGAVMDRVSTQNEQATMPIEFKLNGKSVVGRPDETDHRGREAPRRRDPAPLLHGGLRPDGNCRACMVEIKGERVLAPSCCRYPEGGHGGHDQQRARRVAEDGARAAARRRAREGVHARIPSSTSGRRNSGRQAALSRRGAASADLASGNRGEPGRLHPVHAVRARLPRGAGERRHRLRLPRRHSKIVFDFDDPDGRVHVRGLRRVRAGLPHRGADARARGGLEATRQEVDSVCPYCGVGCQLTYHVKDNVILYVTGKDGPRTTSRLCVKGRYGFDYVQHPHRLTKPLVRKPGVQSTDFTVDPDELARRCSARRAGRRRSSSPPAA